MVWNQRGSWECCANPLSFLDFKLDNYSCICSLLSWRLGFSSPRGSHGWLSLITYEMWFFSWGSPQIPVQCPASAGWVAATQHPNTQLFLLHICGNAGYPPSKDWVAMETWGFPFPVGQPVPACFGCSSGWCRPSQRPFGGISNPAIITSALLPAARTAKS